MMLKSKKPTAEELFFMRKRFADSAYFRRKNSGGNHGSQQVQSPANNTGKQPEHVKKRRGLMKRAEREFPGRRMEWRDGILTFCDTGLVNSGQPVPGIERVEKPPKPKEDQPAMGQAYTSSRAWGSA
jgi:hypothetical protein